MNRQELNALATYNSECARGIMHREDYCRRMAELQRQFDLERFGTETPRPGGIYRPAPSAEPDL